MSASAGRKALVEALRHVGVRESPPGSNRTMFGRWFGVDGVPWCAIFLSYCFDVGSGVVLCRGWAGAGVTSRGVAYVPTLSAWLRATGRAAATPAAGDIAVFDWDGGLPDHAGLVVRVHADRIETVEGNTRDQVMRRERRTTDVALYGRIT
jgi:CHAP domain